MGKEAARVDKFFHQGRWVNIECFHSQVTFRVILSHFCKFDIFVDASSPTLVMKVFNEMEMEAGGEGCHDVSHPGLVVDSFFLDSIE